MNKSVLAVVLPLLIFIPTVVFAIDIIPCEGGTGAGKCDFDDLIELGKRFNTFLIILAAPVATLSFAWAGWLWMTGGANESKRTQARQVFEKVFTGLVFVLGSWLIVFLIINVFLQNPEARDVNPVIKSQDSTG